MQIKNIPFLYGLTCKIGNKLYKAFIRQRLIFKVSLVLNKLLDIIKTAEILRHLLKLLPSFLIKSVKII